MSAAESPTDSAASAAIPASGPKLWRVGTLVYTTAGLIGLFCWLLWGDFGFFLKERAVQPTLQVLLKKFGASDLVLALLVSSLPQAMSLVLMPIIGYRSDRYRSKWGRRIPFLAFTVPIAFTSMVGLAFSPVLGDLLHRALGPSSPGVGPLVVGLLGLSWFVFEFSSLICGCLFHGLIADVVPQAVIGRFYAMFRVVGLFGNMVFAGLLLGHVEEYYFHIFLGIAFVYGLSFAVMCWRVKEGQYPEPDAVEVAAERQQWAIVTYLREAFTHPYYRWIFLAVSLGYVMTWPISLFVYAYAPSIGMDLGTLGKYQTIQLMLSVVQAYPLGWLVDRFHALRVNLATLALLFAACVWAFFAVHDATTLGIAIVAVGTLGGSWVTTMLPLGPTLFPQARFATLNSAMAICYSISQMIIAPVCGAMLDRMNNDYRYMYYWAALMTAATFVAMTVVYRRFRALGGPDRYVAP
ncbi:MAG: MFS transporter [Candidatus Didemnitutus sp.]|nr:MFS transporter [Candidatus Didemnitutus sp.]